MSAHDPLDRPLAHDDPFHVEVRLLLAPRRNPADDPRPAANGTLDEDAVRRAARMLRGIVG
jgi:hypothetical protein